MFGAGNICVTSEAPEKMAGILPEFFDKILVDAPCSGEGMFRRDPSMVKSWNEKGPDYYAPLQRQILDCAVQMLAPGGKLVYSTCTFDRDEDEGTIEYILEKYPQMAVVPQKPEYGFEGSRGIDGLSEIVSAPSGGRRTFCCAVGEADGETRRKCQGFGKCR